MNAAPAKAVVEEVALELGINPAFVEKDWYVVQLIREITAVDELWAQVIFSGGTALSKAHRLIQRFSEDIDFRLILPIEAQQSKNQQRKALSGIRDRLYGLLTEEFPKQEVGVKSRDANRYFSFELDYPSVVTPSTALRPHILIEFSATTLSLPPLTCSVSSFIAELTKTSPEITAIVCLDPVENAVDKMSALIWRVPDRVRQPIDDDPDLVRHIHDLAALQPHAISHPEFRQLTIEMIGQDDGRSDKITGWSVPQKLEHLMEILTTDREYPAEYTRFVQGMSYAMGGVPDYEEALGKLRMLVDYLI